jgi:hypothetical protein
LENHNEGKAMDLITELELPKIVKRFRGMFPGEVTGCTQDGQFFEFYTNLNVAKLPIYLTAIERAGLKDSFAIAEEAWGYNEDTDVEWKLDSNLYGLYRNCDTETLQLFHRAYDEVLKAHPTFKFA